MTTKAEKKSADLFRSTQKYLPEVTRKTKEPFAFSAAKYYSALKKLASK